MPNNNTFTFQELSDFVNSQKDDRKINMHGAEDIDSVGCILVQFARKKYKEKIAMVGFMSIVMVRNRRRIESSDRKSPDFIYECVRKNITNYRQAKQILNSM